MRIQSNILPGSACTRIKRIFKKQPVINYVDRTILRLLKQVGNFPACFVFVPIKFRFNLTLVRLLSCSDLQYSHTSRPGCIIWPYAFYHIRKSVAGLYSPGRSLPVCKTWDVDLSQPAIRMQILKDISPSPSSYWSSCLPVLISTPIR